MAVLVDFGLNIVLEEIVFWVAHNRPKITPKVPTFCLSLLEPQRMTKVTDAFLANLEQSAIDGWTGFKTDLADGLPIRNDPNIHLVQG